MIPTLRLPLTKSFLVAAAFGASSLVAAHAASIIKANNADSLVSASSWVGGVAPTAADTIVFDSTFNATNSMVTGGLLTVNGVTVTNVGQTIGINNGSPNFVAVGAGGIDLSAATGNLTIKALRLDASQTWNIATGRVFRIGDVNASLTTGPGLTGTFVNNTTGSDIRVTGGGTVILDTTEASLGNLNWRIEAGSMVQAIRNNANAFGVGTITLAGGGISVGFPIAGANGNWTFNNAIVLESGTTSFIDSQTPSGNNRTLNLNGVISGAGNLEFRNTTAATNTNFAHVLNAANTYTGNTSIAANATLRLGANGRLGGGNYAGVISGAGNFQYQGSGEQILSGANTYTGTTTVNAGTLTVGAGGSINGAGAVTVAGGTLAVAAGGSINGAGSISVNGGASVLRVAGTVNSTGALNLGVAAGGTLNILSGGVMNVGSIANNWNATYNIDGTLNSTGVWSITTAATTNINGTAGVMRTGSFSVGNATTIVNFTNTGTLTVDGNINLGISGTASTFTQSAGTVSAGGLAMGTGGVAATYSINAGTLNIGASGITKPGTGAATLNLGAATLGVVSGAGGWSSAIGLTLTGAGTIDNTHGNIAFAGAVTGGANTLTKVGAGALTLSGANTYTGATTVSAGRLNLASTNASAISVASGAVLGGAGSTTGSLTLAAGAGVAIGGGANTAAFTANGVTLSGGYTVFFDSAPVEGTVYTVLNYGTGALTGDHTLGTAITRGTVAFANDTTNHKITLTVTGAAVATGTWAVDSGVWDNGLTANWATVGATDNKFFNGDTVIFGTRGVASTVTLVGALSPASVTVDATSDYTFAGTGSITGASALTKAGTGTLTLGTANSYTGVTTINAGTVRLGSGSALGTIAGGTTVAAGATLDLNGQAIGGEAIALTGTLANTSTTAASLSGAITLGAPATINNTGALTLAGVISGAFGLTKTGTGALTLSAANTYTGNTAISAGSVKIGNKNAFGAFIDGRPVTQVTVSNGAAVDFNGVADATYGYTLVGTGVGGTGALTNTGGAIGTGSAQASNITLAADASIGGTGDWHLLTNGYGVTSLNLAGHTLTKTGTNTIGLVNTAITAGTIRIAQGTLHFSPIGGGDNLAVGTAFTLDNVAGATLFLGRAATIGSLAGGGTTGGNVTLGANTLTFGALGTATTYAGVVSGTGSLVKNGAGTTIFTGANTYTGTTTINGGTLQIGNGGTTGSLAGGAIALNAGTLAFNRSNALTVANAITGAGTLAQNGTGVVTLGTTSSVGSLAGAGGLSLNSGVTLTLSAGAGDFTGALTGAGSLVHSGGTQILSGATTYTGTTSVTGGTLQFGNGGSTGLFGTGAVSIASGATLKLNRGDTVPTITGAITNNGTFSTEGAGAVTVSGVISGTGTLLKNGTGSLTLTGVNAYTGGTRVNAGALVLAAGTYSGETILSGIGTTLTLDYTDGTARFAPGSVLTIGAAGTGNSNTLNLAGGAVADSVVSTILNGNVNINRSSGTSTLDIGNLTGGGVLTVNSAGIIKTTSQNNASGFIDSGVLLREGGVTSFAANDGTGNLTLFQGTVGIERGGAVLTGTTSGSVLSVNNGPGDGSGEITLGSTGTTDVNVILIATDGGADGGATVLNLSGGTLRTGETNFTTGATGGITQMDTVTGALSITNGTLTAGGAADTNGIVAISNLSPAQGVSISAVIADNGTGVVGLTKNGPGALTLTGVNTYSGDTTLNGGVVRVEGAGKLGSGNVILGGASSLIFDTTGSSLVSGSISGTGPITVQNGTLVLAGANTYTGTTTVIAGATLQVGDAGDAGTLGAGAVVNNGTVVFNRTGTLVVATGLSGAGSVVQNGTGTVAFSTQKTYTGGTTINAGVLDLTGGGGAAGVIRGVVTVNTGGTLRLSTGDATGYNLDVSRVATINLVGGTLNVNTTANQTLGSAVLNMTAGHITGIAGSNLDFFGGASALNTLAASTASTIEGTRVSLRQGNVTFTVAQGTTVDGVDLLVKSELANGNGTGHLIKAGAGTMKTEGLNSFTGGIDVNAGTLWVAGTQANNNIAVAAGATLKSTGVLFTSFSNNVITLNGGTLELQNWNYDVVNGSLGGLAATSGRILVNAGSTIRVLGETSYGRGVTINGNATLETGANAKWTIDVVTDNNAWVYNNNPTLTLAGAGIGKFDKVLANGTGGLIKSGTGTWTLTATNTYTGGTTVNAGKLELGHATNTLADTGAVIVNGGELALGANSETVGVVTLNGGSITGTAGSIGGLTGTAYNVVDGSVSAALRGTAALVKSGNGTVVLSGVNSYTGTTTITGGTLQVGAGVNGSLANGSAVTVDALGTLAFGRSNTLNFSNTITGAGSIRQMGTGTTVLSGNNVGFTGTTIVDSGVLRLQLATARAGNGAIQLNGAGRFDANNFAISTNSLTGTGTLAMGTGNLTFTAGGPTVSTFDGVVSGSGTLTVDAGSHLVLAGTNTSTGAVTVNGQLTLGSGGSTGSIASTSVTVATGAILGFNRGDTAFVSNAGITGGGTLLGVGAGSVSLNGRVDGLAVSNSGAGTLTVSNAEHVTTVGNTATAAPTAMTKVTASVSVDSILNEAGNVRVTAPFVSGTTTVNGGSVTAVADLRGQIDVLSGGTLTVGGGQGDLVSKISGTATTVNAGGTLEIATGADNTLTNLSGGGTLKINTDKGSTGNTTAGSTVTLDLDASFTGDVVLAGGSATIDTEADLGSTAQLNFSGGTLVIAGAGSQTLNIQVHAMAGTLSYIDFGASQSDVLTITQTPTGTGVIRNRGQGLIDNAAFLPGQILDDLDPLNLYGLDLSTDNFNDTLSIYNTGANASFIVNQNIDGVASGVIGGIPSDPTANDINLVKNGSATLALTGENTYIGTTTVNGGTLQVGNGGTIGNLGSGAVTINTGGTLAFNRTDNITVSNQIGGAGTLAQYGSGTVSLTADIHVGGLGGTGEFVLANNRLTVDGGTFAGVLSGTGSLIKESTGTLILAGDSALNSNLTINSGTVQFGNGGTSGSLGTGEIVNQGTLAFNRTDTVTFANRISGVGALTQAGAGTVILTADNTFLGRTLVSNGVLQVGNGGTTGSIGTGAVITNATFRVNRAGDLTFANTLTGTGVFEQAGTGVLTVTGASGFTGVLSATAGELVVATAAMPSASYNAASGAKVRLEATGDNTLSGNVTGAGDFILAGGTGVTTFTGSTTGTGRFTVESGRTLTFGTSGGSTSPHLGTSSLELRYGSTLKGSGSVAGNLINAGTISPGFSPGHIRIGGDFTQTGTGVLNMEIYGSAGAGVTGGHDQISFGGVATFDGVLNITLMPGFTPTAGFSAVLFRDTDATGGVSFVGDFATINVTGDNGAGRIVTSDTTIAYFAGTSIAQTSGLVLHDGVESFANALSPSVGASHPELANFLAITDLGARANALQNASPIGFAALTSTVVDQAGRESDGLRRRAENQARSTASLFGDEAEWLAYVGGTGGTIDHDNGVSSPSFNTRSFGGYGAIERRLGDGSLAFGVRAGFNRATSHLHNDGGKIEQDHARGTFYMTTLIGDGGFLTGSIGLGHSSYDTKRNTIGGEQSASPTGWDVSFGLDGGYVFKPTRNWSITPYAGLNVVRATVGGFNENGSSLALAVDGYSHTAIRGRVGSTFMYERMAKGFTRDGLRFGLDVAFEQTLSGDTVDIPAGFVDYAPSGTFDSKAPALIKSSVVVGPQVDWTFGGSRTISAGYRFLTGFDGSTGQRVDISFEQRF